MQHRASLDDALRDIEAGTVSGVSRIVVNRPWWDALSGAERDSYRRRAGAAAVTLSADTLISRHFVEMVEKSDEGGTPPLSSEHRI
jgi:hypothetical protein